MKVHLDTDLGGDTDDACALAMMLGWSGIDIVGITTNLDVGGQRAGCAAHILGLAGREAITVVAGAEATMTALHQHPSTWGDHRYWPQPVLPRPSPPGAALTLLADSIADGATVITLGALTNLAQLAIAQPAALDGASVVVMGGWVYPPAPGLPQWGPEMDWNIQCDTRAAALVWATGADLTLVTLPLTMQAHLRAAQLPALRDAGPVGRLLAHQASVHADDHDMASLAGAPRSSRRPAQLPVRLRGVPGRGWLARRDGRTATVDADHQ